MRHESMILHLLEKLIARPSITPKDAGCREILEDKMQSLGFSTVHLRFEEVDNLWGERGSGPPFFLFLGHTDVVPPGPPERWTFPPFSPRVLDGKLYGRGACDMKSSIAAMVGAVDAFLEKHPDFPGTLAFLLTSDEEGQAVHGTKQVVQWLQENQKIPQYVLVGEPTGESRTGDTFKVGRRGSLSGKLLVHGVQGHIAYPQDLKNPVHDFAPALAELVTSSWDAGDEHFPPTSFQVSNLHAGTGADNIIPGLLEARFNFRFHPKTDPRFLQERVEHILSHHRVVFEISWNLAALPYYSPPGRLAQACENAIEALLGSRPKISCAGGTSDGRFLAAIAQEVVELGPLGTTAHQIDEHIALEDLKVLARLYEKILEEIFLAS